MVEPPPVYSSLTAIDKIQLRGEESKKNKRSLFLSPFTFCIEAKKFATIHASVSLIFCSIGIAYATFGVDLFIQCIILACCLPNIPFFLSVIFGIRRNSPNFVLLAAVYMIASFVLIFVPTVIWICCNIPFMFSSSAEARGYSKLFTIPVIIVTAPVLFFIFHAARLYLRVYYDIQDEGKERIEEIKQTLV